MATQVCKCEKTSAQYTDDSKRNCKTHSLSSMGISGAAEHSCMHADSEYETNATQMLDRRMALAFSLACSSMSTSNVAEHVRVDAVASSPWKPSRGDTSTEIEARQMYIAARRNLQMTQQRRAQLHASKGKGKGQFKAERLRSWWDMSVSEQWWLEQLWTGRLHKQLAEAKKKHTTLAQAHRNTVQRFQ